MLLATAHGQPRLDAVRGYMRQLAYALAHLHTNRIAHRDVKPENVLVGDSGVLKLADLGSAKELRSIDSMAGTIAGTPAYMAPEVAKGLAHSFPADMWSYGVILLVGATGKELTFNDIDGALAHRVADPDVSYWAGAWSALPEDLRRVISACLKESPAARAEAFDVVGLTHAWDKCIAEVEERRRGQATPKVS